MLFARVLLGAHLVVASAHAQSASPSPHRAPAAAQSALVITVITTESGVPTLQERVGSWFRDGTQVTVGVAPELLPERVFSSTPREVKVWVAPLSSERAMVVFSIAPQPGSARYLLREVRLVNGFDELGLERIASVIHSAFVALREGSEGDERPRVERELVAAGLLPSSSPQPAVPEPRPAAPPPETAAPREVAETPPDDRTSATPAALQPGLLLAAGYATRLRGVEQLGHGPLVTAGVQLPGFMSTLDALLSAQLLFRSDFAAGKFDASVQTSAFRAHLGLEPALSSRTRLQALLGAGADLAQISAQVDGASPGEAIEPRAPGSQWRGALELTLGIWWRGRVADLGATLYSTFLLGDVHYTLAGESGQRRLVTPWPMQPGLSLQARFRSSP
jgi:hypothetical protein